MFYIFIPLLVHQVFSVTVETSKGIIVGQRAKDGNYTTFFGVPYAEVDEKKPFEEALEYPSFSAPFSASDPSIKCPQVIIEEGGILQCLRLNIYVPAVAAVPVVPIASRLPVFVWFHGGGLAFGSAGEYNATYLVQEGIIVITANYRLGPYGFLCTDHIKNQGLADMRKALKWIKSNIRSFGGDPDKVTIGGESWGASAVDFLLYGDGDFNQAIMQSGSRFSYGVSTRKDNEAPIKLAAHLGHHTKNHKDAQKFLNSANPIEVMRAARELGYVFGVCEKPGDFRMKRNYMKKIKDTPILIGYNSKEAFADFVTQPVSFYTNLREEFFNNLFKTFNLRNDTLRNISDIVWKFYLAEKSISKGAMLEIIDLSSDYRVNYGAERSVTNYLKSENSKVYKYVFSFTEGSPYKNVTGVGAYHTEELQYLFEWGSPLKTEEQFKMRRWMITLWTNFVKYGNPTPTFTEQSWLYFPNSSSSTRNQGGWLPTNLGTRPYLNIDVESEMRSQIYHQRMAFWELLWTAYGRHRK